MKEVQILPWDDLDLTSKNIKTPAVEEDIEFALRGKTWEVDLSADHLKALEEFLAPYIEAAEEARRRTAGGRKKAAAKKDRPVRALAATAKQPRPSQSQASKIGRVNRPYYAGFRAWADAQGLKNRKGDGPVYLPSIETPGSFYYPADRRKQYDEFLEQSGTWPRTAMSA